MSEQETKIWDAWLENKKKQVECKVIKSQKDLISLRSNGVTPKDAKKERAPYI